MLQQLEQLVTATRTTGATATRTTGATATRTTGATATTSLRQGVAIGTTLGTRLEEDVRSKLMMLKKHMMLSKNMK